MPDHVGRDARPRLSLVADLHLEIGDERGSTTATLLGDEDGLVLDVSDPRTLLRCLPSRSWANLTPGPSALSRFAGMPVRITSQGRQLGRVSVTEAGRVRVRPTWSAAGTVAGRPSGRVVAGVLAALAVAAVVAVVRRRRR